MKRRILSCLILVLLPAVLSKVSGAGQSTPRRQPGADITLYAPEQHDLYDGHFVLSAARVYQVAGLHDAAGWNHMSNDAAAIHPVKGTVDVDVDEIKNTGSFVARLDTPEGKLVLQLDSFHEINPCQNGGGGAYHYEHGDSGCGASNLPKTFIYGARWGYGHVLLNGRP